MDITKSKSLFNVWISVCHFKIIYNALHNSILSRIKKYMQKALGKNQELFD
jgi:hypothetical protein